VATPIGHRRSALPIAPLRDLSPPARAILPARHHPLRWPSTEARDPRGGRAHRIAPGPPHNPQGPVTRRLCARIRFFSQPSDIIWRVRSERTCRAWRCLVEMAFTIEKQGLSFVPARGRALGINNQLRRKSRSTRSNKTAQRVVLSRRQRGEW